MGAIIIGAGMSGAATAIALTKIGIKCTIYESTKEIKAVGAGITLMPNGLRMIDKYIDSGLFEELYKKGNKIDNLTMLNKKNNIMVSKKLGIESMYGYPILSFQRPILQEILFNKLKQMEIEVNLGKRLTFFEQSEEGVKVLFGDGSSATGDFVISCDGINSKSRELMFGERSKINKTGVTAILGISKGVEFSELLSKPKINSECMYQIRDNKFNFVCIPQIQNKYFWGYIYKRDPKKPQKFITWGEIDIFDTMPGFVKEMKEAWSESIISKIVFNTQKCVAVDFNDVPPLQSWHSKRVALLGDAAHAMTPHFGQGVNMAFEDVAFLKKCFEELIDEVGLITLTTLQLDNIFTKYEKKRNPRVSKISKSARIFGYLSSSNSKIILFLRNLVVKLAIKILGARMFYSLYGYDQND